MKSPEELKSLKEEVETVNKKLAELTEEELAQIAGGIGYGLPDGKVITASSVEQSWPFFD